MRIHPSFEDLSAHHDGEAPEWTAHVASCATCRAQLADLAALSATVAGPIPAATAGLDPVADALAAYGADASRSREAPTDGGRKGHAPWGLVHSGEAPVGNPDRSRWTGWMTGASAAAVVLLVAGVLALVVGGGDGDDTTTALTDQSGQEWVPRSDSAAPGVAGPTEGGRAGADINGAVFGGDLGEIPDTTTLVARAGPDLRAGRDRAAAGAQTTTAPRAPTGGVGGIAPPTPGVVGSRPCEMQARDQGGDLGPVVYYASATRQGVPAAVLGFAPVGGPITVQVRAQPDCRFLLAASLP